LLKNVRAGAAERAVLGLVITDVLIEMLIDAGQLDRTEVIERLKRWRATLKQPVISPTKPRAKPSKRGCRRANKAAAPTIFAAPGARPGASLRRAPRRDRLESPEIYFPSISTALSVMTVMRHSGEYAVPTITYCSSRAAFSCRASQFSCHGSSREACWHHSNLDAPRNC
jgi:hypothetical protein